MVIKATKLTFFEKSINSSRLIYKKDTKNWIILVNRSTTSRSGPCSSTHVDKIKREIKLPTPSFSTVISYYICCCSDEYVIFDHVAINMLLKENSGLSLTPIE